MTEFDETLSWAKARAELRTGALRFPPRSRERKALRTKAKGFERKIVALGKRLCPPEPRGGSPYEGSANDRLLRMAVGERIYFETTVAGYPRDMRQTNTPKSRRPAALDGREFSTHLWTAVGSAAGEVRYLICLERLK